jgi:RND superfamily putative drug exporter
VLFRLGRFCARRHWPVLIAWAVAVIALGVIEAAHHGEPIDKFTIPGSQSQQALDLLAKDFPAASGTGAIVVYQAKTGTLNDPANKAAIDQTVTNLKAIPGVGSANSPFDPTPTGIAFNEGNPQLQTANQNINAAGTIGYSSVSFTSPLTGADQAADLYKQLTAAAQPAVNAGLNVQFGGAVTDAANAPPPGVSQYSELIGLVFAVVILLIVFGSATSMAVPIGVALVAVATSHNIVNILMASITIGSVAPILGSMIGLGVGIDYSVFIVSRHRQNLAEGMEVEDSIAHAMGTSGSAVLFAGIAVCIALLGLVVVGIPYVFELGYIASLFVAVTMLAALTFVPALLGALGPKINSGRIHKHDETGPQHETLSARWAGETAKRPVLFLVLGLVIMLALAAPVRSMQLGFTDDGNVSPELTQAKAYTLLTDNFGPGQNGPLILAVDLPEVSQNNGGQIIQAFSQLSQAIKSTPGVASVSLPIPNNFPSQASPNAVPTAAIMQIVPTTAPNADATADLVRTLRTEVIPKALNGSAINPSQAYLGGQTATLIDLADALKAKLAMFIGLVILGAFLLLMMVFRSILVPATAAIMNLLSIAASYGVIVLIFQWGWGKNLIGLSTTVPVVAFVPVMMFAVLFGLSMDYEVFLLSRIREIYNETGDNRQSVVSGLAATARVITAAALIMISVFLSFVPNPDPTVKMIGLGMAVAVLLDSTIVRMMLVPSSMELAGKANWWLPKWLDKILPHIKVE